MRTPRPPSALRSPRRRIDPRPVVRSKLGPHQLAFFRGVVLDGLDPVELAKRYLPVRPLPRTIAAHLRYIRQELTTTARKMQAWHLSKILARPLPPAAPAGGPSLEDFSAQFPAGFYSERELLELFRDAYPLPPEARRAARRRARAQRHLRQAIAAIEQYAVLPPQPDDPVEAWLEDGVANALRHAGVATIAALASLVDARGARWHTRVRGLGPVRAAATGLWLRAHVAGFEERVGERSLLPYKELRPQLVARRRKEAGIVPFEYFEPTDSTDGRSSPLRTPVTAGGLSAINDRDAVTRWLKTHLTGAELKDPLCWEANATYRAYRREVERLWAWAVVERGKALSALTDEDVEAYTTFLYDPQPRARWVGPKRPRWHPEWRPFAAIPSPRSRTHILTVIGALFDWWLQQGYIVRNPWRAGPKKERLEQPQFARRSLSLAAWNVLRDHVIALPHGEKRERLRALLALLYGSGLRRAELASATVQDLKSTPDAEGGVFRELTVVGKGGNTRTVPVTEPAYAALQDYFAARLGDRRLPVGDDPVPLFATIPCPALPERRALSAWGINRAVSEAFAGAALEVADHGSGIVRELRQASAHWLRHTFATHAVKYDDARLEVLQKVLGHASITTTANNYVDEDREMRQQLARAVGQRGQL